MTIATSIHLNPRRPSNAVEAAFASMTLLRSLSVRILALLLTVVFSTLTASAGIAPENVVVVFNAESDTSQRIAEEYSKLRNIPKSHLISTSGLPDKERMSVEDFRTKLLGPVLKAIDDRGLKPQIDVIAYSAEIPTAIEVSGDLNGKKLPRIFTPTASVNGLTFLHQLVMAKDPRYLDLNVNHYARRVLTMTADTQWTEAEQRRYAEVLNKLQQYEQAKAAQKDGPPTDADIERGTALLKEVQAVFDDLRQAHPRSSDLNYNRACLLAQLEQADAAMSALKDAVKAGWWDHRHTARDDDLKSLRGREDFKALLEEMKSVDFDVQPAVGFRSSVGWLPTGATTTDEQAPRYLLSTVIACTTGRGTSVDEALAHLRRAVAADGTRPSGTIYFERNGDVRSTTREWAFRNAARQLEMLGVKSIIEDGVLPKDRADVVGAVIGIADFDWSKSGSTMLPGAIVEHLTSFGGVMTKGAGQTPLTEFLKHGAAGSSGTVTEPFAIQAKFPSPFMHCHYASGCTLAESFYQAVTGPYQLLIVGDPLCQPWRKRCSLTVAEVSAGATLSGEIALTPKVELPDGLAVAAFEIYVDGKRLLSTDKPDALRWNTRQQANGEHVLTVLARANDGVQSVARYSVRVSVQN